MPNSSKVFFLLLLTISALCGEVVERREINGVDYHVAIASPENIQILWKDQNGKKLETFSRARAFLEKQGREPLVLMNGGIFEPGRIPSGVLIQDGKELCPLNLKNGKGNFFLKPNGVFYLLENGSGIVESSRFSGVRKSEKSIVGAVQSGPLLLDQGKIHHAFNKESRSQLHRNGVGVRKDGMVVFLMSDFKSSKYPNLYAFAEAFKTLGCESALFLDGDLSQMRTGKAMQASRGRFASMIAIVEAIEAKSE